MQANVETMIGAGHRGMSILSIAGLTVRAGARRF